MGTERPNAKPNTAPGNETVFQLVLAREDGRLNYRASWGPSTQDEQSQWDTAMAVDRIMRKLVPRYHAACLILDEAARLGHKVSDYQPLADFIGQTIFVKEVNDASTLQED